MDIKGVGFEDVFLNESLPFAVLLGGQSGDEVSLTRDESGNLSVRKSAGSSKSRLGDQAQKLIDFPSSKRVQVPKIVSPWDGRAFSMQYIPSRVLGDFLAVASHKEVNAIGDALMGFIAEQLATSDRSSGVVGESDVFIDKIEQLRNVHQENELRLRAVARLHKISREIPMIFGFNHGDFSFENILIERQTNKVWLIDPITSPVESPLIDLGRYLLDLEHGWWPTFRTEKGSEKVARSILLNSVTNFTEQWGIDQVSLRFFKQLAALRILPYTRNVGRAALLDEALSIGM